MGREKDAINNIVAQHVRMRQALATCRQLMVRHNQELEANLTTEEARLQTQHSQQVQMAQNRYQQAVAKSDQEFRSRIERDVRVPIQQAIAYMGLRGAPWNDPQWANYNVAQANVLPGAIRIGGFGWGDTSLGGEVPAMLRIVAARSVLLLSEKSTTEPVLAALQSAVLRLVATFPPGALRLTLIDSVGQGEKLKVFLRLPQEMRREHIFWTPREIDAELDRLSQHIATVTQTRLLNFRTIEEYSAQVGEVSVPYQWLVVVNFPAGFSDSAAAKLLSIVQNGPRTGTYLLATVDSSQPMPRGLDLDALKALCTVISVSGSQARWNDPQFSAYPFSLDGLPAGDTVNRVLDTAGAAALQQTATGLPFEKIRLRQEDRWKLSSADGLSAVIGLEGSGALYRLDLGKGLVHHGLVGGQTRSGKTNLLHVLLVQLISTYAPEDLQLYLVDLKEGVEFQDYATSDLPHVRVVTGNTDREFGLSVLAALQRELEQRAELFRRSSCTTIQEYRRQSQTPMPRVLLMIDEYQVLFSQDDGISSTASTLLADLVRRGAAFGLHILLSSQSPASTFMSNRAAMNQLALRVALRCPEADARLILGDTNDAAKLLERSGEAIFNSGNGLPQHNVFAQVALLPADKRRQYLKEVAALPARRTAPLLLFDGKAPAHIVSNSELCRLLAAPDWAESRDPLCVWLGESIGIQPPVPAVLERRSRSNLIIVGPDEETGHALLASALLALCTQRRPDRLQIQILSLGRANQPWSDVFDQVAGCVCQLVEIADQREAAAVIERIATTVEARNNTTSNSDLVFVVAGLDRLHALNETDKWDNPGKCAVDFTKVIGEGPQVGVFTIAWTETIDALERVLRRRGLAAFGLRVALPLNSSESNLLLDGPQASRLDANRALFRDESKGAAHLEKFKPYALPTQEEMGLFQKSFGAKRF